MPVAGGRVRGGSAALPAAGGAAGWAAAMLAACGEALEASATRGVTRGLRGRSLEALAGEGGVGRDLVTVAPGYVAFGDGGITCDEGNCQQTARARPLPSGIEVPLSGARGSCQ